MSPHGTRSRYVQKCRCEECKAAASEYSRAYRASHAETLTASKRAYREANAEKIAESRRLAYNPETSRLAARAYYEANQEERRAYQRTRYEADRQRFIEYQRAYVATHREKVAARDRAYGKANRERRAAYLREWTRTHRAAVRLLGHVRRAREVAADTRTVTARDWDRLVSRYHGCCAYCGRGGPMEQEHVIPLSRGGRHAIGNLLPACRPCNTSKRAQLLVEWRYRPHAPRTGLVTAA
jgi:5-methylcytosine-specific restriction endonuclease McrA